METTIPTTGTGIQPREGWLLPPEPAPIPAQAKCRQKSARRQDDREEALKRAQVYSHMMENAAAYIATERPKLKTAADVADIVRPLVHRNLQEELWVLQLDTRNHLIEMHPCTVGIADRSQAHAREVFRDAIRQNCTRIILAHNHPSGDPMPSPQDVESTNGLVKAGKIIGIEVVDHVVIGQRTPSRERDWVSLRELNLM
jgi:DNA repair protein RadC